MLKTFITQVSLIAIFATTSIAKTVKETPKTKNPACVPVLRTDWSKDRTLSFGTMPNKDKIDVLFLGDSITQLWEFPPTHKYPGGLEVWKKVFVPMKAKNFGIAGDLTEHVLWRITEGKNLDGANPKVVVLLIGTNNLHRKGKPDTPEQIAEGIELLVKTIRQKLPESKILLLGVLPRGFDAQNHYRKKIIKLNQIIAKLDDQKHVFFLDIGDKLLNKDGSADKAIFRDGLHLSPKGYQMMADLIQPEIQKLAH